MKHESCLMRETHMCVYLRSAVEADDVLRDKSIELRPYTSKQTHVRRRKEACMCVYMRIRVDADDVTRRMSTLCVGSRRTAYACRSLSVCMYARLSVVSCVCTSACMFHCKRAL